MEVRHRARVVRQNDQRFGLIVVGAPFGVLALFVLAGWAYTVGETVEAGDVSSVVDMARYIPAWIGAITIVLIVLRILQTRAQSAPLDGLLTTARHRDVVYGRLLIEFLVAFAFVGFACIIGGVAFALGAGSPVTAALSTVAVVLLLAIATEVGFALGLGIQVALSHSRRLARHKIAVSVLVIGGYVLVLLYTDSSGVFEPILDVFGVSPLTWFGDLALLAVAPMADPLRAGAVVLGTAITLPGLAVVNTRLASLLWYSTPVTPETATSYSPPGPQGFDRRMRHVVWKTWTRAIRSPLRLVYVGYAGLLIGFMLSNAIQHDDWPGWLAPLVALYGTWATGAGVSLNPIGEETPILSATLTTTITGRRFIGGLWLASVIPGVPITLATSLAVASASGLGLVDVFLISLLSTGLAAFAPGLASGIGAIFPQTETEEITRNRSAVVPSLGAFTLYSILLFALAAPGWVAISSSVPKTVSSITGLSSRAVSIVGIGVSIVAVGVVAVISYRIACSRFDAYTPL